MLGRMDRTDARTWLLRQGFRAHQAIWWTRAVTLGVRALVLDGRSVLLVRHTYRPGWFLPGGGVDRGESAEAAAVRELREEAGILCGERPALFGFYRNGRHDHVACYVVRKFERGLPVQDLEIAESGFFPVDALPPGTTPSTQARLAEVLRGAPLSDTW
jgi:ADP-ribose pyrophosphatase YjhB (NUDIX family)